MQYNELEMRRREEAAKLIQLIWRDYIQRSHQYSSIHYPRSTNTSKFSIRFYSQIAINRKLRNSWKKYEISHADLLNSFFFINQPSPSTNREQNQSTNPPCPENQVKTLNVEYEQLRQMIKECNRELKQELLQEIQLSLNSSTTNNNASQ